MKNSSHSFFPRLTWFILLIFSSSMAFSQIGSANYAKNANLNKSGVAIEGYDPVAYFTEQKAVEGKKDISITVSGVKYYFSSTEHRDLFKSNPDKYSPQYGGWCAYAMGDSGEKVDIDPKTFKLTNGKLYLFYNKFFNNTRTTWNKNETALRTKADANWEKIIK